MPTQQNARERLLELARMVRGQLDEEEIGYPSGEEALKEIKKSFETDKPSESAEVIRGFYDDEVELMIIDFQLWHACNNLGTALSEKGYKKFSDVSNGMYISMISDFQKMMRKLFVDMAISEHSQYKYIFITVYEGDLVILNDEEKYKKLQSGNGAAPKNNPLSNLFQNGAMVVIPILGGISLQQPEDEEEQKKPEFEKSDDGKVVFINPPSDKKH